MNPERTLLCAGGPVDGWRIPVNRPELLIDLYKVGRHRYVVHTMARGNEMEDVLFYAGEVKGPKMPHREEPDMLTTYAYEVLVAEKLDKDGKVLRPATLIQEEDHLLEKPTREGLLVQFAADLAKFDGAEKITNYESEVVVNIRPFC